jgi:hypothetical protein
MREILEKDQRQIAQEVLSIEKEQFGPPRRLPMAHEIPSMDMWKRRAAQNMKKIQDLNYTITKAKEKRDNMLQQLLTVAKTVASLKAKNISLTAKRLCQTICTKVSATETSAENSNWLTMWR